MMRDILKKHETRYLGYYNFFRNERVQKETTSRQPPWKTTYRDKNETKNNNSFCSKL